jgi:hypothetical protein
VNDDLLAERWAAAFLTTVKEVEQRSGVDAADWRVGGRRTKANPDGETLEFWQSEGLRQVEAYLSWLADTGWSIAEMPDGRPGIEWDAEVSFGGTPIRAVVDCVYTNGSDLIVVDYKTGSRTPSGVTQLGLYASVVERAHGVRPQFGGFYMTRNAALDDLTDLTPWGMDFFDYSFGAMNAQLATGYFAPNVSDHCSWCGVRDYCYAVNGSKSSDYPIQITGRKEDE